MPNAEALEIILQHGWAFDSTMWVAWQGELDRLFPGATVLAADRGYFGKEVVQAEFQNLNSQKIIVAHSLGLHLLPRETLRQADKVILVASFLEFHGDEPRQARLSRLTVKKMLQKLDEAPNEVLDDFYKRCQSQTENSGAWQIVQPQKDSCALEKLKSDLELLNECHLKTDDLFEIPWLVILHGNEDRVVPVQQSLRFGNGKNGNAVRRLHHETAGHNLPYNHHEWCLKAITDSLAVVAR